MKPSFATRLVAAALAASPAFAADPAHVREVASTCATCHPASAASDDAIPPLAGMPAAKLREAMRAFKSGTRAGSVMPQLARGYTDDDIDAVAVWYASQRK